jgi:hypothetical protein
MAITYKLIQTRPSTSVDFWSSNQSEVITKIEEFKTAGKIISYNFNEISENQLEKTMTVTFNTSDDHAEYLADNTLDANADARETYCDSNNISTVIEQE